MLANHNYFFFFQVISKTKDEDDVSEWNRYGAVVNTALDIEVDENAGYMDHFFREVG